MGSGSARWSQIVAAVPGSSTSGSGCTSCLCVRSADCASITAGAGSCRTGAACFARFRTALPSEDSCELDSLWLACEAFEITLPAAATIAAVVLGDALSGDAVSGAASGAASGADSAAAGSGASAAGTSAGASAEASAPASTQPSVESSASQSLCRELLHPASGAAGARAAACWLSTASTSRSPAPAENAAPAKNNVANDRLTAARRRPERRFGSWIRVRPLGRSTARQTAASESRTKRNVRLDRRCFRSGMCRAPISL